MLYVFIANIVPQLLQFPVECIKGTKESITLEGEGDEKESVVLLSKPVTCDLHLPPEHKLPWRPIEKDSEPEATLLLPCVLKSQHSI